MIKNNDFIKLEYTGKIKENNRVFDTTNKDIAIKNNLFNPKVKYEPVAICLGNNFLVPGLEKDILDNKEIGKEYVIDIKPEDAFGKKDPKNLKLVPISAFKDQKITPRPELRVQIGNNIATIKTVTGGRCVVDFNNPLSGHEISYTYKVLEIIEEDNKKVDIIFKFFYGLDINSKNENGVILVKLPDVVPNDIIEEIKKKIKDLINIDLKVEKIKVENRSNIQK